MGQPWPVVKVELGVVDAYVAAVRRFNGLRCGLRCGAALVAGLTAAGCPADDPEPAAETGESGQASTSTSDAWGEGTSIGAADVGDATERVTDETAGGSADETTAGPIEGCWDDLEPGSVEVLYDGFAMGSEGLAFGVDGSLYATTIDAGVGTVWRLDPSGTAEAFAELPYALGLAPLADGTLVVASIGENAAPDGGVYTVATDGSATLLHEGMIDSPNFVAIAPDGSALVSDDFDTRIFRVGLDGAVSVVVADVPSPNGMAFNADGTVLYVASTFTDEGQLTRFDVDAEGLPIERSAVEIMHLGPASTPDGIALDIEGNVYVAANLPGQIWRVDGTVRALTRGELVADGLASPASLAFGAGEGFDPCSIYATELFGNQVVRVTVGIEGGPLFR